MNRFASVIRKISLVAVIVGGCFLIALMMLNLVNVLTRAFGGIILGAHELTELIIVVTVAGSFAYVTIERGHIVVGLIVDRLSKLPRGILYTITSTISVAIIAFIVWANIEVVTTRWLSESSKILGVPWLPFRLVFVIGLTLFGLTHLLEIYNGLRMLRKK
jgi:TRAP-type C4-dicarboxylate transport system permease small subunit